MRTLRHAIPGLLGFEPAADSPEPGDEEGLLATCGGATWDGEHLRLDVKLAWAFASRYVSTFGSLTDAIVLVAEDAASGSAFAMRTIDPHKKYLPRPAPNWSGPPPPAPAPPLAAPDRPIEEPLPDDVEERAEAGAEEQPDTAAGPPPITGSEAGWVGVPCEMTVAPPEWPGPSVFVTARLHGHASNTLALELAPEAVRSTSFLWSRPWEPARFSSRGPMAGVPRPPPGQPSLALRAASPGAKILEARLRLTAEDLAAGGPEAWLRSVFICAIQRGDQSPFIADWLGERLALEDDLVVMPGGGEARLTFDLGNAFGNPLRPGIYDVQVSARHHRSEILEVTVP